MFPRIIGIHGPKRSGKHTVARLFVNNMIKQFGVNYYEDTFAAPLRAFFCSLLGTNLATLDDIKEDPLGLTASSATPRDGMGTIGRAIDQHFGDVFTPGLFARLHPRKNYIIPDVRLVREATGIRSQGGAIIHLVGRGELSLNDPFEAGIPVVEGDFTLHNDRGVDHLLTQIKLLIDVLHMRGQTSASGR